MDCLRIVQLEMGKAPTGPVGILPDLMNTLYIVLATIVIVLPLAYAFSLVVRSGLAGVSLIWWAIPIAEALSCAAGCVLLRRIRRKNFS